MLRRTLTIGALALLIALLTFSGVSSAPLTQQTDGFHAYIPIARLSENTTRVSISSDGLQANDHSTLSAISADGRFVAFYSDASNLVSGDTNGVSDAFVHDRQMRETTRVSVASNGAQGNRRSGDLWFEPPSISADGRYVAFVSKATNLVSADTNELPDIFVHDRETGETTRVSVSSDGVQGNGYTGEPTISADGRFVAFTSGSTNLVDSGRGGIFLHERATGVTRLVAEYGGMPALSADGRYMAVSTEWFDTDDNRYGGVFVHDLKTGEVTQIARLSGEWPIVRYSAVPAISADGRYVAFYSDATDPIEGGGNEEWRVFIHDRQTGETEQIGVATDSSRIPLIEYRLLLLSISDHGRYVAFESNADIVDDDTNEAWDVFVYDRERETTTRISVATNGAQGNGNSKSPSMSGDGRQVAFGSKASNLVNGDTNMVYDIFVRGRIEP